MAKVYDSEGFQLVARSRRRGQCRYTPTSSRPEEGRYTGPSCKELVAILQQDRERMDSGFIDKVKALLHDHTPQWQAVVCYGIGRVGTCSIARQQLGLLLSIANTTTEHNTADVSVYDPVLSSEEIAALAELGCHTPHHNELCRHKADVPTLYYMPHCGRAMYNNLLWANWNPQQLARVALIGNSFQSYAERIPTKQLENEALYISNLLPHCSEWPLPPYPDPTVFNDLALHTFTLSSLQHLPPSIWQNNPPPYTDHNDPEIIVS